MVGRKVLKQMMLGELHSREDVIRPYTKQLALSQYASERGEARLILTQKHEDSIK
jgi:hypothetical protein